MDHLLVHPLRTQLGHRSMRHHHQLLHLLRVSLSVEVTERVLSVFERLRDVPVIEILQRALVDLS